MCFEMEYYLESCFLPTASLITILFAIVLTRKGHKYILPPGPRGLPLIGNILSFVKTPIHLKLSEWATQFGDVYTIHLGPSAAVVVNDVTQMKEIFGIFPASTGKLLTETFQLPFKGKYGLVCVDSQMHVEQRQFCVKSLRTFGFGKGSTMEPMLIDEVNDLIAWLQKEGVDNHPVMVLKMLQKTTFNALWTMITGQKIAPGDTRFASIMEGALESVQKSVNTGLAFLPWLKHFAPEASGYKLVQTATTNCYQFITEHFEEHQRSYQEGSPPRDLIEAYMEQMRKETNPLSSFYGDEGWKHSIGTIIGLLVGGGETTATVLTWLIFYLGCHQDVQKKLQEEIDRVVGSDTEPSLKDKLNMPFTDAVIQETLRKSSLAPIGLVHQLTQDTHFQNYHLPKGTLLIANLYHAHYSKDTWTDPEIFRPERFLDGDKKLKENVVAFQVGRRQCLGEGLARDVMFLFVVKLCQKFHFDPDPKVVASEYMKADSGFVLAPKRLGVLVTARSTMHN